MIGNNTAYEIVTYLAGQPTDNISQLVAYIISCIMIIMFFISVIYLMKVILVGVLKLGDL
jgi:ABC-type multidrug transport system permease subunit